MEDTASLIADPPSPDATPSTSPKKPKAKKRLSDFEIFRTILQRTCERKLPYMIRNMGEDRDLTLLFSGKENDFVYGSEQMALALFYFESDEIKTIMETYFQKLHGYSPEADYPQLINVRDQCSELVKTKGASIDREMVSNAQGSCWTVLTDKDGRTRDLYFNIAIDSLFHVREVESWCKTYRSVLLDDHPDFMYYPYRQGEGGTASLITLPPYPDPTHPMAQYFPHGFRLRTTRGIDLIQDKFIEDLPYPIEKEELIFFSLEGAVCHVAHRLVCEGWRMLLLRPNTVFFPASDIPLRLKGQNAL